MIYSQFVPPKLHTPSSKLKVRQAAVLAQSMAQLVVELKKETLRLGLGLDSCIKPCGSFFKPYEGISRHFDLPIEGWRVLSRVDYFDLLLQLSSDLVS